MGFFLFVGLFVGILGHGWELFWLVFVFAFISEVLSRTSGKTKLKEAEAKLASVLAESGELANLAAKARKSLQDLRDENIVLRRKLDDDLRKSRQAGMQAVFEQYLDARYIFDENLEKVVKAREDAARKERERSQRRRQSRKKAPESKKPWWEVLGVSRTATALEVKAAYRKLAMQFHPDRSHDNGEKMAELNVAKEEAEAALV